MFGLYFWGVVLNSSHRTPVAAAIVAFSGMVYLNNPSKISFNMLLRVGIISSMMLASMYAMNFYRQGLDIEFGDPLDILRSVLSGMATSIYMMDAISRESSIEWLEHWYYFIIGAIPRILWESKPITSFNVRITEMLYGYTVGSNQDSIIYTFTVPGEGYVQFGYVGAFLLTLLSVVMYRQLISIVKAIPCTEYILPTLILSWFINFRGAFDSVYWYVIENLFYIGIFVLIGFIKIGRSTNPAQVK